MTDQPKPEKTPPATLEEEALGLPAGTLTDQMFQDLVQGGFFGDDDD